MRGSFAHPGFGEASSAYIIIKVTTVREVNPCPKRPVFFLPESIHATETVTPHERHPEKTKTKDDKKKQPWKPPSIRALFSQL